MEWAFLDHPVPFGIAHRGGTEVAPGNTEAAFDNAVSLGYRYIETDVQTTADGVLVIFHDPDLGPTTDGSGPIARMTWAELSEVRVGGKHPIPRFEDILERFPEARFNIEPKTDPAVARLIDVVRERQLQDRVCIGSFSDRRIKQLRRALGPDQAMSPGPRGVIGALAAARRGSTAPSPYAALQIPPKAGGLNLTRATTIKRVKAMGLQVHVWTINSGSEMNRLLDAGVDAIMTDQVTLLRSVLTERGHWGGSGGKR